jgi:NAD(P)-dependent dehydrogenase (short-subunit alcohol dehydrogenase family)
MNHINVKIMGYVRCVREVITRMIRRGGGRIINIEGMTACQVGHLTTSNGVTNASIANITENLSDQVAQHNILVHCIYLGTMRTPRQAMLLERRARDLGVSMEEAEHEAVQHIPIGRMMTPEDVADLILLLMSERASAITGQVIAVEGGSGRGLVY